MATSFASNQRESIVHSEIIQKLYCHSWQAEAMAALSFGSLILAMTFQQKSLLSTNDMLRGARNSDRCKATCVLELTIEFKLMVVQQLPRLPSSQRLNSALTLIDQRVCAVGTTELKLRISILNTAHSANATTNSVLPQATLKSSAANRHSFAKCPNATPAWSYDTAKIAL